MLRCTERYVRPGQPPSVRACTAQSVRAPAPTGPDCSRTRARTLPRWKRVASAFIRRHCAAQRAEPQATASVHPTASGTIRGRVPHEHPRVRVSVEVSERRRGRLPPGRKRGHWQLSGWCRRCVVSCGPHAYSRAEPSTRSGLRSHGEAELSGHGPYAPRVRLDELRAQRGHSLHSLSPECHGTTGSRGRHQGARRQSPWSAHMRLDGPHARIGTQPQRSQHRGRAGRRRRRVPM
jgi:hypothetical protein